LGANFQCVGYHLYEDLAKFGYKQDMNEESLSFYFILLVTRNKYKNLAIGTKISLTFCS
jgi:hypothetical protein